VADPENLQWSFYRFHIVDPVYFKSDCKVTIQQMGGTSKREVIEMQNKNVPLIPVTVNGLPIFSPDSLTDLESPDLPGDRAWTNFYRSDDVSAVVYYYLDSPADGMPPVQSKVVRTANLKSE
jgi:hypothetical protein